MMMYGVFLCLCLCDSFHVFACGVCGILGDDVWCVVLFVCDCCVCVFFHVFVGVACDLLCGDVWFGFVCVVFVCACSVFKKCSLAVDGVMLYGLSLL